MKEFLKVAGILFATFIMVFQLCACSSSLFTNRTSDDLESKTTSETNITTTSKSKKTTLKKTTKKSTTKTKMTEPEDIEEEPEEEIEEPEEAEEPEEVEFIEYEPEEETEETLQFTELEIGRIVRRVTKKYQDDFNKYEKQYLAERDKLSSQLSKLESDRAIDIAFERERIKNNMANGQVSGGRISEIEFYYENKMQPIRYRISQLDDEYNTKKNGLQAAIDQAVQIEILKMQNGY